VTKTRKLTTGVAAAIAAGALLTGVAFATSDDDGANIAGSAMANLATSTTLSGEAKGYAISAAAKAADNDNDADDTAKASTTDRDAHGDAVSMLARTTTLTGEAKGDAISALASSKSHRTAH